MPNLYTVVADSGIVLDKKIDEILKGIKGEYDLVDLDMEEDSIITLLSELKTLPFLSDFRVIKMVNPKFLVSSSSIDSRLMEEFIDYCKNPIETTILITIINPDLYSKIKKDSKDLSKNAFNALTDKGALAVLDEMKESDIDTIIENELEDYQISKRALDDLKLRVMGDPTRLICEISKLKLYKDDIKKIDENDVDLMVSRDLEDKVYLLTSAIISKSRNEALSLYSDFKLSGVMDSQILSSIINKFQELYIVKVMATAHYSKDDVAEAFHVKSGRAYYMMQDASKIRLEDLKMKYDEVVGIDYKIKRGTTDRDNALWLYLLNV